MKFTIYKKIEFKSVFTVQTVVTTTTMSNNVTTVQCQTASATENAIASNACASHAHVVCSPLKTILSIITTSSPTLSSSSSTNSTSTITSNSILTNTIYNPQYLRLMQFSSSYIRRHSVSGTDQWGLRFFFNRIAPIRRHTTSQNCFVSISCCLYVFQVFSHDNNNVTFI